MTTTAGSGLLDGLIASKLHPPMLDPRAISRAGALQRALDGLPEGRIVTVVAPAGSGKSSLMTQLHRRFGERGIATSWLGLDAEDNDPATFARYFISALHTVDPLFAHEELTALGANPVRDYDALFRRLASRLSALDRPVAIFLDDFQHLGEPHLLRFFDGLLAHLPKHLSLVIASRHQLPLPLARLSVADRAVEIGQDELNFDHDQTDLFLRRYHQLALAPDEIERLVGLTEGWPTGVQLAALALRRHRGSAGELLQTFSGRDRDLTRYLAEAVIRAQPDEVRRFLLRTSVLRRMCAELCDAVGASADARAMLEEIGRANLFLIALDRDGRWYRYHHLFAEFLQNEFRRTDPAAFRSTCLSAARWCDLNGEPAEAIRYALDAEYYEQAAELIARHALRTSLFRGDHYSVRNWMQRLPEAYHGHSPELRLAYAWSCAFSRDTERAMQIAEVAMNELRSERWSLDAAARARWCLWAEGVQAATCACADAIEHCLDRSMALLPRLPPSEPFLFATLGNCLSYSHFAQREFARSREFAILAHEHGHRAGASYLSSWGDFLHGLIEVELGELRAASRFGERLRRESAGLGLGQKSYVAGLSALLDAEIAVQRGDFDGAAEQIEVGRAFKEIFGPVEPQLVAIRNEARLHAHHGRLAEAQVAFEEGLDAALREQHRRLYVSLAMEQVSLLLTHGQLEAALKVVRRTRLLDDDAAGGGSWERALRDPLRLLGARLQLAQGDARSALRVLSSLQQARSVDLQGPLPLSIAAHRAAALWALGQTADAVRQLDRALGAAAPERHGFPILSVGSGLLPILDAMEQRRTAVDVQDLQPRLALRSWLIDYLRGEPGPPAGEHEPVRPLVAVTGAAAEAEELTEREIELLRLLRSGLDNRQIADTLFVSVSTVKWHLHNVYGKLAVGSRGAAVAKATRLGVL